MTRPWDDEYKHSIFKEDYFAIMLSDQHMISMVPSLDGHCIPEGRLLMLFDLCKFKQM